MTMKTDFTLSRRQFLGRTATLAAAAATSPGTLVNAAPTDKKLPWKFCAFEKPLLFLSYDETADFMAELGFDGIEAAVRPGGHVLPERVEEDLPKFVEALKKRGLEITILTSGINSVEQPHTEKVLRTAAKLGIQRYRMLWYRYDLKKNIVGQLEAFRTGLKDLVTLNREIGISGLYQNHAGAEMLGASLWDIYDLVKGHAPKDIGIAYDTRHAQVEAGQSWTTQFQLIKSHVTSVFVKDFIWEKNKVVSVPLGAGRVDKKIMNLVKEANFTGPISLHVEYSEDKKDRKFFAEAFRKDFATLKEWLKTA